MHARLPEAVQTLYAELLDQLRAADAEQAVDGVAGTFVSKVIRDRTYWYLQVSEGGKKRQVYLGAETPELLETIAMRRAGTADRALDSVRRRELIAMLAAGGMIRESAAIAVVMRILGDAGVFRAGGVLVGTQAFTCMANMLGVIFDRQTMRTADVDVAHDASIPLGISEAPENAMLEKLRVEEPRFVAVPPIDAHAPSTSFRVRGRDLRVDFLTPARKDLSASRPILLRHLGVAAQPLEGLGFLIAEHVQSAFVGGSGVLVNVPSPSRFALHKLWVASVRPVSEAAKRRKDLRQAEQILSVLLEDRPGDITRAWQALPQRMRKSTRASLTRIDSEIAAAVQDAALSRR
jgi:hypothetical protein